jgi:hypothetical protein
MWNYGRGGQVDARKYRGKALVSITEKCFMDEGLAYTDEYRNRSILEHHLPGLYLNVVLLPLVVGKNGLISKERVICPLARLLPRQGRDKQQVIESERKGRGKCEE